MKLIWLAVGSAIVSCSPVPIDDDYVTAFNSVENNMGKDDLDWVYVTDPLMVPYKFPVPVERIVFETRPFDYQVDLPIPTLPIAFNSYFGLFG